MDYFERMQTRVALLRAIRRFFEERDFTEVDTPVALSAPAPELHIEAPRVDLTLRDGRTERFLQTSPELPMKRLLARGFERIFQVAPTFRDGDESPLHRPEFRMLEWYRRGSSWTSLVEDCEALLVACAQAVGSEMRFSPPFPRVTVDEAFRAHAGFSILEHLEHRSLFPQVEALRLRPSADDTWDDLFHRVFLERVEPALVAEPGPFFLVDYPAPLASLARLRPDDSRVAERFELYLGGVELANGFGELVDPEEQRKRFMSARSARIETGGADYPLDERFFTALGQLPASAGIALGFDRLVLYFVGEDDLDATAFLPWNET